jgi:hypothetical protein
MPRRDPNHTTTEKGGILIDKKCKERQNSHATVPGDEHDISYSTPYLCPQKFVFYSSKLITYLAYPKTVPVDQNLGLWRKPTRISAIFEHFSFAYAFGLSSKGRVKIS